jgi:hypothetical protein
VPDFARSVRRLRDNVVTDMTLFNKLFPPLLMPSALRRKGEQQTWTETAIDLRRSPTIPHHCTKKRKRRLRDV